MLFIAKLSYFFGRLRSAMNRTISMFRPFGWRPAIAKAHTHNTHVTGNTNNTGNTNTPHNTHNTDNTYLLMNTERPPWLGLCPGRQLQRQGPRFTLPISRIPPIPAGSRKKPVPPAMRVPPVFTLVLSPVLETGLRPLSCSWPWASCAAADQQLKPLVSSFCLRPSSFLSLSFRPSLE